MPKLNWELTDAENGTYFLNYFFLLPSGDLCESAMSDREEGNSDKELY